MASTLRSSGFTLCGLAVTGVSEEPLAYVIRIVRCDVVV